MTISVINEPVVCNNSGRIEVRIENVSPNVHVDFFDPLLFCFDEAGESDVLVTGFSAERNGVPLKYLADFPAFGLK
ncbi:MAG: hypothetical protein R2769_04500 [Saprospiraceae bacterium]